MVVSLHAVPLPQTALTLPHSSIGPPIDNEEPFRDAPLLPAAMATMRVAFSARCRAMLR